MSVNATRSCTCLIFAVLFYQGLAAYAAGFAGYYAAVDPIPCSGLATFEDQAVYLRDRYISPTGSDVTGDGALAHPWQTPGHALALAQPGDVIHLLSGVYGGAIYKANLQGTAAHPIKIVGPTSGAAIISGGNEGLHLVDAKYVILRNFSITAATDNALNVDDGGSYSTPTEYLICDDLNIHDYGSGGNNDGLKLSGVDHFYITNCRIINGSSGWGSCGVDMVGCHNGVILYNRMETVGQCHVQTKGGSADVTIHANYFKDVFDRGINIGGSTDAGYFRPSIASGVNYEARHIRVTNNIFIDTESAVAFVGADECLAAHNVIYQPTKWALRILQETVSLNGVPFIPSRRGEFDNNLIVFSNSINQFANVGDNTEPSSFRFANNLWYCSDNPSFVYSGTYQSYTPTTQINPLFGQNPLFVNGAGEDFHLTAGSPAINGAEFGWVNTDYEGRCDVHDIGAFRYIDANLLKFSVRIWLEGPFQFVDSQPAMTTTLIDYHLLPPTSPYHALGWEDSPAVVSAIPLPDIVDWILISLHSTRTGAAVFTKSVFIGRDGWLRDRDGAGTITAPLTAGNYYLVLRHRNHLPVMSANLLSLTTTLSTYDLTGSALLLYQNGGKNIAAGCWGMPAGDITGDGYVTTMDYIALINAQRHNLAGYANPAADLNLDGQVQSNDFTLWLNNARLGLKKNFP
jgi:hypothetical protein